MIERPEFFLRQLFDRAVEVADPMRTLKDFLPEKPKGRVIVVGAGKASARMAEAVEAVWGPCEGLVITRYGYGRPCRGIEIVEAAHPVPDEAGLKATARLLDLVESAGEGDFVLALISGGASALLVQPVPGVSLAEKQAVNQALLASGAPIDTVFDWRQTGPQTWDIAVDTDNGRLLLSEGGNTLRLDGEVQLKAPDEEYPAMYRRFVDLVASRAIDADTAPLRLVADAFLCGRHCPTAVFED